jgi:flagellar biosynthetic protein FlhB|tara:strand:+ start:48459 stop:49589 length:1131 start_codon:yes stop_codon:yes gene_type:complete
MAEQADQDQKTEQPTDKKRRDAAREGDVPKSRELLIAGVMLGGTAYLVFASSMLFDGLSEMLTHGLRFGKADIDDLDVAERTYMLLGDIILPLIGLLAATLFAAIGAQALLGGLQFNMRSVRFKGNRLNPGAGLKRMVSMNSLIELAKSLLKVVLIGSIGTATLWLGIDHLLALGSGTLTSSIAEAGSILAMLLFALVGALIIVAAVDVPVQLLQRVKKLRMTKQEVKDEMKQSEGSPEVRAAIRRRQREAIKRDVRQGVEVANVVLTNPTHFAVALRYDTKRDAAPVVVAMGKGEVAAVIRELADQFDKPILSYPQLTRALYFTSKVGMEVRSDLYIAVATILAFIFDLNRDVTRPRPDIMVPTDYRFDEEGRLA